MEWNTKLQNQGELEKELMAYEIMRLRRNCKNMYDAIKHVSEEINDAYEAPNVNLPEKLYQSKQSAMIIIGHVEHDRRF